MKDIRAQLERGERARIREERRIFFGKLKRGASWLGNVIMWIFLGFAFGYFLFSVCRAQAKTFVVYPEIVPQPEPEVVYAIVTAYTSSVDETDDTPFITASGQTTRRGIVACPAKYPFGTVIEFEGERYECQDRMNLRYREDSHFDVWVETKSEAWEWGKKQGEIVVLADEI